MTHNQSGDLIRSANLLPQEDLIFSEGDRLVLKQLAGEVAQLAARPQEQAKRRSWSDLNRLKPARPVIFCFPENAWSEFLPADKLVCSGKIARQWEFQLRQEIYWGKTL